MKTFPTFPSHDAVDCFHCKSRVPPDCATESAFARGSGEFKAYCPACDRLTFYDLSAAPARRGRGRALAVSTAAVFAAIIFTMTPSATAAPKPRPKQTAAEFSRQVAQRLLIESWEECLGDQLSDRQTAYLWTITEHAAQRYLLNYGGDDFAECKLLYLNACEQNYPGECVATAGERNGRQ